MSDRMLKTLKVFSLMFSSVLWGAASQFPGAPGTDPWDSRPNDPDYADLWHMFSHLPKDHTGMISEQERALGSGMSVDKAWQFHTGSAETMIALLDSGVYWDASDIRDRIYINTRELPPPQDGTVYDRNGDGRVSISDYEDDPRVSDLNRNGMLDVGDLILAFSNGRDDDGNGFVDDISGWDFHEHDNDPGDRIRFGHGTGEAKDSVAAADNGIGGLGACPNCSVMFLRVNDSFVVDANSFSAAVHYGVDQGAAIIQEALGSINSNPFTQEAVNYAWDHNVVAIGSAADENSYHHNYPATLDPVIYVDAIRHDTAKANDATTFMAFNNCSNLGARVDVAASGISCSSEATGNLSGIAALASSYARSLGKPLSAGELTSLIKMTATDINFGSNERQQDRHSTWKGWDRVTGYGRVHAGAMLQAIAADRIPPAARIVGPRWFELFRDRSDTKIPVVIETGLPRSGRMRARLEVTRGVDTADSQWLLVKESGVVRRPLDGLFSEVAVEDIDDLPKNLLDGKEYEHAFTFRLTVDNLQGQRSEARRTLYVFDAPNLREGFPKNLGASGESSGLFVDLDGNGSQEYVSVDGAGYLHAFTSNGSEHPGFPVLATGVSQYQVINRLNQRPSSHGAAGFAPLASADLDGDGKPEVVVTSLEGHISVVHADGSLGAGSPVKLPFPNMAEATNTQVIAQGIFAGPAIADLDHDGVKEVVVAAADGLVYVFESKDSLSMKAGFPVAVTKDGVRAKIMSSPALYDVDGDGIRDIVVGTNHAGRNAGYLFAINGRGKRATRALMKGFPVQIPLIRDALLPTVGTGIPTAPAIADIDGDGIKEIVIHGFAGKAYVVGLNGLLKRSLSLELPPQSPAGDGSMITGFGHPGFANVGGNGVISPVVLGTGSRILVSMAIGGKRIPYHNLVSVWNGATGLMRAGFPRLLEDIPLMPSPVSADITGDGQDEVILGTGGYFVHAFSEQGEAAGFPAFTGGWMLGAPSVGDIDGDGRFDIAGTTREGYLFVWKTDGFALKPQQTWPTFKGNNARTGVQGEIP